MFICKTLHPGSQSNKRIRVSSGISLALDQIVRLLSKDLPQSCLKHKIKDKDNTWNFLCYFYMTLQKVICASTRAQNLWSTIWQTPRSAQQAKITLMKRCFDKKLYIYHHSVQTVFESKMMLKVKEWCSSDPLSAWEARRFLLQNDLSLATHRSQSWSRESPNTFPTLNANTLEQTTGIRGCNQMVDYRHSTVKRWSYLIYLDAMTTAESTAATFQRPQRPSLRSFSKQLIWSSHGLQLLVPLVPLVALEPFISRPGHRQSNNYVEKTRLFVKAESRRTPESKQACCTMHSLSIEIIQI